MSLASIIAADELPNDGYDYSAALAQFRADYAAEVNKTAEDWDGTRTMTLAFGMPPTIKGGNVVGSHQIMQHKVFNDKSEHKGRTINQSVNTFYSPENPGVYLSLGQLRSKYPQFEGKRAKQNPGANDLANQMAVKMMEIKKDILGRRAKMLQRIEAFSKICDQMEKVYEAENQRVGERLADLKVPGSSGKGQVAFDPFSGEMSSDNTKSNAGDGVHIAQDELIVWEMENAAKAERDWKSERARVWKEIDDEEKKINKLVADYLSLKKAGTAVKRARENNQMNGDDALVRTGMQTMDSYR